MTRPILVTGATGNIDSQVVKQPPKVCQRMRSSVIRTAQRQFKGLVSTLSQVISAGPKPSP